MLKLILTYTFMTMNRHLFPVTIGYYKKALSLAAMQGFFLR
jgi:hypothetical protein